MVYRERHVFQAWREDTMSRHVSHGVHYFLYALLLSPSSLVAEPAGDVFQTIESLQMHIESGVFYNKIGGLNDALNGRTRGEQKLWAQEYNRRLGNADLELRSFLRSREAANSPQLRDALSTAMARSVEAGELLWRSLNRDFYEATMLSPAETRTYVSRYPAAAKSVKEGGAMWGPDMLIEYLLKSFIWPDAAGIVKNAKQLARQKSE
jgi:hypothetical protein